MKGMGPGAAAKKRQKSESGMCPFVKRSRIGLLVHTGERMPKWPDIAWKNGALEECNQTSLLGQETSLVNFKPHMKVRAILSGTKPNGWLFSLFLAKALSIDTLRCQLDERACLRECMISEGSATSTCVQTAGDVKAWQTEDFQITNSKYTRGSTPYVGPVCGHSQPPAATKQDPRYTAPDSE
eukprot:1150446-Pelagomonas_calceolata.AAC.4